MKEVNNNKDFKVLSLSFEESQKLNWGISEGIICMNCNDIIPSEEEIYYIAVLNDVMCKKCYEKWLSWATRYPEDIPYEEKQFKIIKSLLS